MQYFAALSMYYISFIYYNYNKCISGILQTFQGLFYVHEHLEPGLIYTWDGSILSKAVLRAAIRFLRHSEDFMNSLA